MWQPISALCLVTGITGIKQFKVIASWSFLIAQLVVNIKSMITAREQSKHIGYVVILLFSVLKANQMSTY